MSYLCAECRQVGCKLWDMSKTMTCCPSKNEEVQTKAAELYRDEENYRIANAAYVDRGYGLQGPGGSCAGSYRTGAVWCLRICCWPLRQFHRCYCELVQRRYKWDVKREWILFTPGVVPAFNIAYQSFFAPGDGIIRQNTVFHYAPSKTFNLAGLQTAYVVIPNDAIRARLEQDRPQTGSSA